jgi:hypothetical protein
VSCTAWLANGPSSQWIGPQSPIEALCPVGTYDYRTTFNLTGYDAATAVINGSWITDNIGEEILINGVDTGSYHPDEQFTTASPFTITSGFVPGLNTLDFIVCNAAGGSSTSNPTALRVEMSGTATPEPSTLVLLGIGAISLLAYAWRRTIGSAVDCGTRSTFSTGKTGSFHSPSFQ